MASVVPNPQEFDISPAFGFCPEKEPLQCLPEYFSPWEELERNLPELVKNGEELHQRIQQLPLLDHDKLSSEDELKRAHLVLACISHAYMWCKGDTGVVKILPKCLAVPWVAVSSHLDLPPILMHASYFLYNWKCIDPSRPVSMDNMGVSVMMTGSSTERGFIKVGLQVELDFGKGLHNVIDGQKSVQNGDKIGLTRALKSLMDTIVKFTISFLRTKDVMDPDEFYNNLRPYLAGWHGNPALPDGLIYEGVSERPLQYSGGSQAQSPVFQVLDVALGVFHSKTTGGHYLERMRQYMLPKHRAFIEAVSQGPSIRHFALTSGDPLLVEAYNQCVDKLKDFRNAHLQVVTRYIIMPANRRKENKELGMALRGTGGSDLVSFLKQIRNDTSNAVTCNNNNADNNSSAEVEENIANGLTDRMR